MKYPIGAHVRTIKDSTWGDVRGVVVSGADATGMIPCKDGCHLFVRDDSDGWVWWFHEDEIEPTSLAAGDESGLSWRSR